MAKFSVCVSTTFDGYVEVDASSKDAAIEEVWEMIRKGHLNCVTEFDPYTEIPYAEEVKNEL